MLILGVALLASFAAPSPRPFVADAPKSCASCAEWNAPREPYRVHGNTYYVGTAGLSAILITSEAGHVLIDGGLPQSAPLIDASIRTLGFRTEDVRLILNSHAHYDHAGGIAALQRASGAAVAAGGAAALRSGGPPPDDPQFAIGARGQQLPPRERRPGRATTARRCAWVPWPSPRTSRRVTPRGARPGPGDRVKARAASTSCTRTA